MLAELLSLNVYAFLLVFARLGAALMILPGFGELTISARVRLVFALALSVAILPLVVDQLPPMPEQPIALAVVLAGEILVGLAVGMMTRMLIAALQVAGTFIAYHSGVGSATLFDPTVGQQGAIMGAFLTTLGVTLLFITNLHHLMLTALVDSYFLFEPGAAFPVGDLADTPARLVAQAFRIGLSIAMPIVLVALIVYVSMGLIARLVPQIHIFFIALPLQIALGLTVLALTLSPGMMLFLSNFESTLVGNGAYRVESQWPTNKIRAKKPKSRPPSGCRTRARRAMSPHHERSRTGSCSPRRP